MMQLEMLAFKFQTTKTCEVDKAQNGFEAFENVMSKFNSNPR